MVVGLVIGNNFWWIVDINDNLWMGFLDFGLVIKCGVIFNVEFELERIWDGDV